ALTLGADDYVPKPGDGLEVGPCIEELLIPKIKLLGSRNPERQKRRQAHQEKPKTASLSCPSSQRVEVVAIGASTGGPNALAAIFPAFPQNWSVPILIVQHMPPDFTARLAERLSEKSGLRVREAQASEPVSAAQAWVAPGDYHLVCRRKGPTVVLDLNKEP